MAVLTDTHDVTIGPAGSIGASIRASKAPHDLGRSARVGMSLQRCTTCGVTRNNAADGVTSHLPGCDTPGTWRREVKSLTA